jgi:xylulokinase
MKRIFATGGGSVNRSILQILADIFGKDVWTFPESASAALGAAHRALHGFKWDSFSFACFTLWLTNIN